jgi:hypothetical protein
MKFFSIGLVALAIGVLAHSNSVTAVQKRSDAIFNDGRYHYQQIVDLFGTVSRTATAASGRVIGTQVGTYSHDAPNGMVVEMTYLQPDAEHPDGQAFDGDGNPLPLH